MTVKRGLFIVFEGGDRSGKTSQISILQRKLEEENHKVKVIKFPNRESKSGQLIDAYLKQSRQDSDVVNDHAIHLLFSANRWEMKEEIQSLLLSGTTLLVDRYSYSGIAYSSAKGLDVEWCKGCDRGLPSPDIVFYFSLDPRQAAKRGDYGVERYETIEFQEKVAALFKEILLDAAASKSQGSASTSSSAVVILDADREKEIIGNDVYRHVSTRIQMHNGSDFAASKSINVDCSLWQ